MKKHSFAMMALLACTLTATSAPAPTVRPKKAIAHGWDLLWTAPWVLRENLDRIGALPFDGISMTAHLREPGKTERSALHFFDEPRFECTWFTEFIEVAKLVSQRKSCNFLTTMWSPKERIAWDDDRAWERVSHNLGVLAHVAKASGCRGIILDPEEYMKSYQYVVSSNEDAAVTAAWARKRGAQLMKSMVAAFPDITLLSFYLLSNNTGAMKSDILSSVMARRSGKLWPDLVNGFLDAMPPEATLVDGTEYGYAAEYDANGFYRLADDIRHRALELVAPENRDKYRNQVQVGFGHYLDAYLNRYGAAPKEPMGTFNPTRLFNNIQQGMQVADEYCWFYGEKWHFLNWSGTDKKKTWEQMMPGFYEAIEFFKAPTAMGRQWLDNRRKAGTLPPSRITNPDCRPGKAVTQQQQDWKSGNLPNGWSFWQGKEGMGSYGQDTTCGLGDQCSLTAKAIGGGCFITDVAVKGGEFYVIEGYCRGGSFPDIGIRWFNQYGWLDSYYDLAIVPDDSPVNNEGWKRMVGTVVVPPQAVKMVLLLGDNLIPGQREQVWFDSVNAYPIHFSAAEK